MALGFKVFHSTLDTLLDRGNDFKWIVFMPAASSISAIATRYQCILLIPRLWIELFELNLVGSNRLAISVEYQEASRCGSLINGTHKYLMRGLRGISHLVPDGSQHPINVSPS